MPPQFSTVIERFEEERGRTSKESTAKRYARHVRNWNTWLSENHGKDVWEAETADLRLFIRHLDDRDLAPTTISQRVSAISKFYQDLERLADMHDFPEPPENPYEGLDTDDKAMLRGDTKKKRAMTGTDEFPYLTPDEVDQLRDNVPSPRLRNELLVKLLFNCGFRRGELAKVKMDHLDFEEKSIYIPPRKSPSGRWVTWNPDYVGFHLRNWKENGRPSQTYADESDYLFPTNDSLHISGDYINQMVREAAEEAGLQETITEYADGRAVHKVTAHTLRHSYAMQMLRSGVDIRTLQELLGHEELDTTLIYLQQSTEDTLEEARRFSPYPSESA